MRVEFPMVFGILCLWFGLVFSISFLETPLKFSVPGMDKSSALLLGRRMFNVSTNIQLFFMVILLFALYSSYKIFPQRALIMIALVFIILLLEKIGMLPTLNRQIEWVVQGGKLKSDFLHIAFVFVEILKLILILIAALLLVQKVKI